MNATDYLINAALVLLVLRQIREMRLSWQILVLPVLIVIGAAAYYLRSVPLAGNDVVLYAALGAVGATLGGLCGLATHLRRDAEDRVLARAGWIAAILWVVGVGARMGFAWASTHGAGPAIERFSIGHSTSPASTSGWRPCS
jgi:peptidoglycan/LPS O-acetylase OafA/YrhL